MYANKGKTNYQFAIGKQSADYLRQMIRHRRNFGEKIDDESWLFRSYDRRPPGKTGREFRKWPSMRGPAMAYQSIWRAVDQAATAAGVQNRTVSRPGGRGYGEVFNEIHPHIFRSGTLSLLAIRASPSVIVTCSPSAVAVGSSSSCIAMISGYSPTGVVTFTSSSSTGIFMPSNGQCTLSSGRCQIAYLDTAPGAPQVTGTYGGDANNGGSQGSYSLSVNPPPPPPPQILGITPLLFYAIVGAVVAIIVATVGGLRARRGRERKHAPHDSTSNNLHVKALRFP